MPLVYRPGDLAEVDFFEVVIDEAGVRRKAWMFLMRLMYSGRDFAWLYQRQDQVSFLDGHVRAFAHFGGVPTRLAYDNLRAAVRRILVGAERALTLRFAALASHYLFEPCFCRPATGHDKGGVEARGKAIRWQHLVPIPAGPDLATINAALLARLDGRLDRRRAGDRRTRSASAGRSEQPALRPLAPAFRGGAHGDPRRVAPRAGPGRGRHLLGARRVGRPRCHGAGRRRAASTIVGPGGRVHCACRANASGTRRSTTATTSARCRRSRKRSAKCCRTCSAISGAPFPAVWTQLDAVHGPREAARVLAKVLGQLVDQGASARGPRAGGRAGRRHPAGPRGRHPAPRPPRACP